MSNSNEPIDGTGIPRSETKYGGLLPDEGTDALPDEPTTDEPEERTSVVDHEIEAIYHTDPSRDDGYGREKYSEMIRYDDATGDPYVLFVVEHRWKGNYWRDTTDWDWRDVPEPVREQIAAALPVDGPETLDSGSRLMDEGGESRWEKYHSPRVEALSGDEMWGLSYLRDALGSLETASEAFDDGSTGESVAEKLVSETQTAVRRIDEREARR